jgi:hypothetical protein
MGFSWLWGHFGVTVLGIRQLLEFVEVFGFWFLEIRQGVLFLVLEVQSSLFQDFFNRPPIKVWKKSQPLQQHMNHYHKIRKNACQKERLATQLRNSSSFLYLYYYNLDWLCWAKPYFEGCYKLGCCCKA